MDSQDKVSMDDFISRKLHPVRILVGYLNNEMALNTGDEISMERGEFESIVSTLEMFVEDYDRVSEQNSSSSRSKKKKKYNSGDNKSGMKAVA